MRTLKTCVIVELNVPRQSRLLPMQRKLVDCHFGGDRCHGPTRRKPAMYRNPIENLDVNPALDDQSLNHVKAVELRLSSCDRRQIPSLRRRHPTNPTASVQRTSALENAPDRTDGRHRIEALEFKLTLNSSSAVLAQYARFSKVLSNSKNLVLNLEARPRRATWSRCLIRPIHPIKSLTDRLRQPILDRRNCDPKLPCNLTLATTAADSFNQRFALTRRQSFFSSQPPRSKRK